MDENIIYWPNTASNARKKDYLVFKTSALLDKLHLSEEAFALLVYMLATSMRHYRYNFVCYRYVKDFPNIPRTVVPRMVFRQCLMSAYRELFDKKVLYKIEKPGCKTDPQNIKKRIYISQAYAFVSNKDWFMKEGYMWIEKKQVEQAMEPLSFTVYEEWMRGLHNNH